jgi:hypothetical protein
VIATAPGSGGWQCRLGCNSDSTGLIAPGRPANSVTESVGWLSALEVHRPV